MSAPAAQACTPELEHTQEAEEKEAHDANKRFVQADEMRWLAPKK